MQVYTQTFFFIRKCLIILCLLLLSMSLWAQNNPNLLLPNQYTPIKNLRYEWQYYSASKNAYIPYLPTEHGNTDKLSLWLDLNNYPTYQFCFYSYKDTYLFINNQLCKHLQEEGWYTMSLDSLQKKYQQEQLFITIVDAQYRLPLPQIWIVNQVAKKNNATINEASKAGNQSNPINLRDFITIIILVLLSIIAILRNLYPKTFSLILGMKSVFQQFKSGNNTIYTNPIGSASLFFMVLQSAIIAFFYKITQNVWTNVNLSSLYYYTEENLWYFSLHYLILIGIVWAIFLLKYILLLIFSIPIPTKALCNTHFYEAIRLNTFFYTLLLLSYISIQIAEDDQMLQTSHLLIPYIIAIFHTSQTILLSYQINNMTTMKNLYLFYYLCTTELTPLLIGLKFLIIQ